jgi:hypothetical protein
MELEATISHLSAMRSGGSRFATTCVDATRRKIPSLQEKSDGGSLYPGLNWLQQLSLETGTVSLAQSLIRRRLNKD